MSPQRKRQSKIASPLSASVKHREIRLSLPVHAQNDPFSPDEPVPRLKAIERVVERVQCQDNPDFWSEPDDDGVFGVEPENIANRIFGRRKVRQLAGRRARSRWRRVVAVFAGQRSPVLEAAIVDVLPEG
jgi:hypothetical protein